MTIGSGLVVANIYYNQPLLGRIAQTFAVTEAQAGTIAMLTQVGYASGLLFIVPLGDMLRRKRLILADFVLIILALLLAAFSPNVYFLMGASWLIGTTSSARPPARARRSSRSRATTSRSSNPTPTPGRPRCRSSNG